MSISIHLISVSKHIFEADGLLHKFIHNENMESFYNNINTTIVYKNIAYYSFSE